jgi:hypothetical protein
MKKPLLLTTLISIMFMSLVSCKKDRPNIIVTNPSMENIQVPDQFDWKTTKDYTIVFSTSVSGLVEVSNIDGIYYQRAFLTPERTYSMKLTVPSFEKKVNVKLGTSLKVLELSATQLTVNF